MLYWCTGSKADFELEPFRMLLWGTCTKEGFFLKRIRERTTTQYMWEGEEGKGIEGGKRNLSTDNLAS